MTRTRREFMVRLAGAVMVVLSGCNSKSKPQEPADPTFRGLGITFHYPEPYKAELATSNPNVHQVAVDHPKEPGVLTIRLNPKQPNAAVSLEDEAEATVQRMGPKATVEPTTLVVGKKSHEARAVKTKSMGLVATTDVVAVVPIGGKTYVVLTHAADEDKQKASLMFAKVLSTLAAE